MKRRRKAKSHDKKDRPASRSDMRISRRTRLWLLAILVAICAGVGGMTVMRRFFAGDQMGQHDPNLPRQGQTARPEIPPFTSGDPSFRPIEATSEQLILEATEAMRRLADRFPHSPACIDVMARLEYRFGNSAEAVAAWEKCLQLDPNFVDAYCGIGSAAAAKQEYGKAADCFRKPMELDPASSRAPIDLAHALMNLGRLDEVTAVLEKSTKSHPQSMPGFLLLGQAYYQLKEYEKAKRCFEAAVKIAPEYPNAYYSLALTCARLGQRDEARKHREEFSKRERKDRKHRVQYDTTFDDYLSVRESLAQAYTDAGRAYRRHGNVEEAEKLWRQAAALDPKNRACREDLAALYEQDSREHEALSVCEELLEIDPANADYSLNVGLLNARLNRFAAACSAVERAIELDPRNPRYREAYELIKREAVK